MKAQSVPIPSPIQEQLPQCNFVEESMSAGQEPSSRKYGVVVLANDHVIDWMVAWLNSFREHNPWLAASIIPYDGNVEKLTAIANDYDVDVLTGDYSEFDRIGASLASEGHPRWVNMFRKFAAFEGPYENTIYLDSDIIIVGDLSEVLMAFEKSEIEFCFFDETDEYIYMDRDFLDEMKSRYGARLFNAGFWCAKRGTLSRSDLWRYAGEAMELRAKLYSGLDQPILNYCIHRMGLKHASVCDLLPEHARWHWAAPARKLREMDGVWRVGDEQSPDFSKRLSVLHWAGFGISPLMPYRDVFLRYRLQRTQHSKQSCYLCAAWLNYLRGPMRRDAKRQIKQMAKNFFKLLATEQK